MLAILFQEKTKKKMLVFPKNAEKNASTIEKGLGILLMDNTYRTKKTLGDRASENVAPKVWNRLPLEIFY